jgi:hypothetical protein
VYRSEGPVYYTVLLLSGIRGIFSSAYDTFAVGAEIEVKVASVDRVNGEVRFENS